MVTSPNLLATGTGSKYLANAGMKKAGTSPPEVPYTSPESSDTVNSNIVPTDYKLCTGGSYSLGWTIEMIA